MRVDRTLSNLLGLALMVWGIAIPSNVLIEWLRGGTRATIPMELWDKLELGGHIFSGSLVVLGLAVIALGWRFLRNDNGSEQTERHYVTRYTGIPIVVVLLLVGLILRMYGLENGLWIDEIAAYVKYIHIPMGELITTYDSESQHLLYSVLANMSVSLFGDSSWALRLPASMFGVGSLWAMYLLGREVAHEREALISVAMLTFSYHHIWFSQNARGYTGLLFWTLLSSWALIRGLRHGHFPTWLIFALTAALGVFTHLTMLFVVAGQFVVYLIALLSRRNKPWPERWMGLWAGFCLAGLLTLQFYALVLPQLVAAVGEGVSITLWKNPLWTLQEMVNGLQIHLSGTKILILPAAGVIMAGAWRYWRTKPEVVWMLIIPAMLGTITVVGMGHHLWPRFYFFAMGFGVLVAVKGMFVVTEMVSRILHLDTQKLTWIGSAFCLMVIVMSSLTIPRVYAPKQDFGGALKYVEAHREKSDAVATVGLSSFPYGNFYRTDWTAAHTIEELNALRSQAERTWVVYIMPAQLEAFYPEVMSTIKDDFQEIERFRGTLNGGTVFISRVDFASSPSNQQNLQGKKLEKPHVYI